MKNTQFDPAISALFESAANLISQRQKWINRGFICDPCDPKLPLLKPEAFYADSKQFINLIATIIDFIKKSDKDLLFLKGPRGSGKTTFANIFQHYCRHLNLFALYQDASILLSADRLQSEISSKPDVIFLDNAFHLNNTLRRLDSGSFSNHSPTPKIVAILDSTEFEVFRRECIRVGSSDYLNFCTMPVFSSSDISTLLSKRLQACLSSDDLPESISMKIPSVAAFSLGNSGFAIRVLGELLRFSQSIEDACMTFGINPIVLQEFSPSKSPILREILIREIENDYPPYQDREYIIHKELTHLMNKTKSTISHHLSDLLDLNLIYEHSTRRDKRERAYRPNKTIIGLLEYLAFEISSKPNKYLSNESINYEK